MVLTPPPQTCPGPRQITAPPMPLTQPRPNPHAILPQCRAPMSSPQRRAFLTANAPAFLASRLERPFLTARKRAVRPTATHAPARPTATHPFLTSPRRRSSPQLELPPHPHAKRRSSPNANVLSSPHANVVPHSNAAPFFTSTHARSITATNAPFVSNRAQRAVLFSSTSTHAPVLLHRNARRRSSPHALRRSSPQLTPAFFTATHARSSPQRERHSFIPHPQTRTSFLTPRGTPSSPATRTSFLTQRERRSSPQTRT